MCGCGCGCGCVCGCIGVVRYGWRATHTEAVIQRCGGKMRDTHTHTRKVYFHCSSVCRPLNAYVYGTRLFSPPPPTLPAFPSHPSPPSPPPLPGCGCGDCQDAKREGGCGGQARKAGQAEGSRQGAGQGGRRARVGPRWCRGPPCRFSRTRCTPHRRHSGRGGCERCGGGGGGGVTSQSRGWCGGGGG